MKATALRIATESLHTISHRLLRNKHLTRIFPIPHISRGRSRRPGTFGPDGVDERFVAADGRADSTTQDGEAGAGSGVEEEVQEGFLLRCWEFDD